jgi:hypothetical protein
LFIGISRNLCRQIYLHGAAISQKLDFRRLHAKSRRLRVLPIEPVSSGVLGWSLGWTLPPTLGWALHPTLRCTLHRTLQCILGWTLYPTLHPTLQWTLGYALHRTLQWTLQSTLHWTLHPTLGWTLHWTLHWSLGCRVALPVRLNAPCLRVPRVLR